MFDLDAGKLLIVGAVALIFIPPKDLPRVLRQAGQFVGKMKRMASEFQGQFMDAMREADMADLRREAQQLSESTRLDLGLDRVHAANADLMKAIDRKPEPVQDHAMSSVNDKGVGIGAPHVASAAGDGAAAGSNGERNASGTAGAIHDETTPQNPAAPAVHPV